MQNPFNFRMPTHVAGLGTCPGEKEQFELAVERAYEAILEALQEPMTEYALLRTPIELAGDERDDCITQLQLRYIRMVLAKVNMDNFVDL